MRSVWTPLVGLLFLFGCSSPPEVTFELSASEGTLLRGRYLVEGAAACSHCHATSQQPNAPLGGGLLVSDALGEVIAPNISPHLTTGIGAWSADDVVKLLRRGERPDGSRLASDVHDAYHWLSDEDVAAIATYLLVTPEVENLTPRRDLSTVDLARSLLVGRQGEVRGVVPPISSAQTRLYGEYLVDHVARCNSCHMTPGSIVTDETYLTGGRRVVRGEKSGIAPDITPTLYGIGSWGEEELARYLRSGITPDGTQIDPALCPTNHYRNIDRGDMVAMVRYLRSIAG